MKSPLCYEVRSCEFPLRTGAISLLSSTTFANACIVYVGKAGRRISSAYGNRSLFLLSTFITLLLFLCGEERTSSDLPPPPRIAPCREFTTTVECKKAMMMCVAGIRQT